MVIVGYLLLGIVLCFPLIYYAHRRPNTARVVFAIGLIVAAAIYLLFAAMANRGAWIGVELFGVVAYGAFALLGLRNSMWWLVLGWAMHPIWDIAIHHAGAGAEFTPDWYAWTCVSFDAIVAAYIAHRIVHARDQWPALRATTTG